MASLLIGGRLSRAVLGCEDTPAAREAPSLSGDIALSPDGTSLAVLTDDQLELWRLSDFSRLHTWEGYTDQVRSLDVSPDGQVLAAGDNLTALPVYYKLKMAACCAPCRTHK